MPHWNNIVPNTSLPSRYHAVGQFGQRPTPRHTSSLQLRASHASTAAGQPPPVPVHKRCWTAAPSTRHAPPHRPHSRCPDHRAVQRQHRPPAGRAATSTPRISVEDTARVAISPFEDSVDGISGILFDAYVKRK